MPIPEKHWYAIKVFYNRKEVIPLLERKGIHYYQVLDSKGKPVIPGLIFVNTFESKIKEAKDEHDNWI